jgi:hypothetical protein
MNLTLPAGGTSPNRDACLFCCLGFRWRSRHLDSRLLVRAICDGWNRRADHWSTTVIVAEMRAARHREWRGPGVLFRGGSQRRFEDGSQAEEFVLPPAEGMIMGESSTTGSERGPNAKEGMALGARLD